MESPVHAMDRRKKMGQDKQQDVTGKGYFKHNVARAGKGHFRQDR